MRHREIEDWLWWRFFGHQAGGRISKQSLKGRNMGGQSEGFGVARGG